MREDRSRSFWCGRLTGWCERRRRERDPRTAQVPPSVGRRDRFEASERPTPGRSSLGAWHHHWQPVDFAGQRTFYNLCFFSFAPQTLRLPQFYDTGRFFNCDDLFFVMPEEAATCAVWVGHWMIQTIYCTPPRQQATQQRLMLREKGGILHFCIESGQRSRRTCSKIHCTHCTLQLHHCTAACPSLQALAPSCVRAGPSPQRPLPAAFVFFTAHPCPALVLITD